VHAAGHLRANLERTAAIAKASEGVGAGCGLYQVVARVNVDSWASMGPADCIAPCIPTQHKCSVRCVRHNLSVSSDWPLLRSSLIIKPISQSINASIIPKSVKNWKHGSEAVDNG
jgi:hypothetical protein